MIVTDRRYMVGASGARDGNCPVEVQSAVKKRPRQGNGVGARGRDDICTRGQSLRHCHPSTTECYANKNKGADDRCHCRACRMITVTRPTRPIHFIVSALPPRPLYG